MQSISLLLPGPATVQITGLHVSDTRPAFLVTLAVHIATAGTAVIAGLLATTARKRPGRHTRAGTVYLYAITGVFLTASVLAGLRWREDWHLFLIAAVVFGLAALGWWARRRWLGRTPRGKVWHGSAMAGSYIALFTGFYVDNGPQLPLWDRLPHAAYWFIPSAVGIPLTWWALRRSQSQFGGIRRSTRVAKPRTVR